MQNEISKYDFVDCLLVDFEVDKLISTLVIITEAYYPYLNGNVRKKGLLKIKFCEISKISIVKNDEFDFDITLSYDKEGNHYKANEFYSINVSCFDEKVNKVMVISDMIKLEIECNAISLIEME